MLESAELYTIFREKMKEKIPYTFKETEANTGSIVKETKLHAVF